MRVSGGSWCEREFMEEVGVKESLRRKWVRKRVSGGSWCERESQEQAGVKESLRSKLV